jgi:hypothetical protein
MTRPDYKIIFYHPTSGRVANYQTWRGTKEEAIAYANSVCELHCYTFVVEPFDLDPKWRER